VSRRSPPAGRPRFSARLQLALSYAVFLVVAGCVMLIGVYIVLRYVPNYPLPAANPGGLERSRVASRQEILDALIGISGFILAGLALVGIVGGWILAGWILRPLQRINNAALIAATGRLDHRIRLYGRNDEFRQVADSFNLMLDRLQDAFAAQERFAANASHELRTPLAITETLLDVARANPNHQNYPELLERLSVTNDRAISITEALLRLADANAVTAVAKPMDLAMVVNDAISENSAEAVQRGVTFHGRLEAAPTVGDPTLLLQLATNLIQNAIRHNHAPGTAWIETYYDQRRATVTLQVENTGSLITPETAAQLTEPFLRGQGRISQPGELRGHGLGLTLVSRVVDIHGGTLSISPRDEGGLVVAVSLPDDTYSHPAL
jgi:two-component system, OmpR family, sensor histidine kinase VanS